MSSLLAADEPAPFTVLAGADRSPFVIACDHAGQLIPRALGDLGVSHADRQRHIAWDIGAAAVCHHLAPQLGAFTILQTYSRLVIDCNRDPAVPSAFVTVSEETPVPGNHDLSPADRAARIAEIFTPYHDRLAAELDRRQAAAVPSVLIAMHSFTPVYRGVARPLDVGVLFGSDPAFSLIVLALLEEEGDLVVRANEPYALGLASDYTVPVHGLKRGLPYVELEIRQDLITTPEDQRAWSDRLARLLPLAWTRYQQEKA